jgi:uncharacterized protein (DUF433 family)
MVAIRKTAKEKADLIAKYIEQDPHHPGLYNARLNPYGVSVWMIISRLEAANSGDLDEAAADYDIPREAVEAALAYYEQHKAAIDARIEAQRAQFA